jgi:hypothetical protein
MHTVIRAACWNKCARERIRLLTPTGYHTLVSFFSSSREARRYEKGRKRQPVEADELLCVLFVQSCVCLTQTCHSVSKQNWRNFCRFSRRIWRIWGIYCVKSHYDVEWKVTGSAVRPSSWPRSGPLPLSPHCLTSRAGRPGQTGIESCKACVIPHCLMARVKIRQQIEGKFAHSYVHRRRPISRSHGYISVHRASLLIRKCFEARRLGLRGRIYTVK